MLSGYNFFVRSQQVIRVFFRKITFQMQCLMHHLPYVPIIYNVPIALVIMLLHVKTFPDLTDCTYFLLNAFFLYSKTCSEEETAQTKLSCE